MSARPLDTRREIFGMCTPARLRRGAVPLRLDAVLCSKGVSRKVEGGKGGRSKIRSDVVRLSFRFDVVLFSVIALLWCFCIFAQM